MYLYMNTHHLHSPPRPFAGLTGFPNTGKDVLGQALVKNHGFTVVRIADPIREALEGLDPIVEFDPTEGQASLFPYQRLSQVVNDLGWETAKRTVPDIRRLLQNFGTESIRALDPGFWIRIALKKAEEVGGPVVFTDVRFPNEAEAIRRYGGILVRVERPGYGAVNDHASESALENVKPELIVLNVGPKRELEEHAKTVATILSQIGASL